MLSGTAARIDRDRQVGAQRTVGTDDLDGWLLCPLRCRALIVDRGNLTERGTKLHEAVEALELLRGCDELLIGQHHAGLGVGESIGRPISCAGVFLGLT